MTCCNNAFGHFEVLMEVFKVIKCIIICSLGNWADSCFECTIHFRCALVTENTIASFSGAGKHVGLVGKSCQMHSLTDQRDLSDKSQLVNFHILGSDSN